MRRSLCTRRFVLAAVALALGVVVSGAPPANGEIIADPMSTTVLTVTPADRTQPGVELTLVAEVTDSASEPVAGEQVRFTIDGDLIAFVVLDGDGRAQASVTPPQGAHTITASYRGRPDQGNELIGSFDEQVHSVLPEMCADEAHPGAGAVVRHAYLVALRRCPDPEGYAYWVGRVEAGANAGTIVTALARSIEAVEVVADDAYRRILGRPAEPAGRRLWALKLRSGWTTSQLWAALAASSEFALGTDGTEALVERAFTRIVGRTSDPGGLAYWRDRLAAGGGRASSTWRAMAVTAEVVDGVVDDAHGRALGRGATDDEAAAARATVRSRRGDWRPLVAELLGRPEASTFAQRYPDLQADV